MEVEDIYFCSRCKFPEDVSPVTYRGSVPALVLFMGEAPGRVENDQGNPFVHLSGSMLEEIIAELGLKEDEYAISNCVLCFPKGNHGNTPTMKNISNCERNRNLIVDKIKPQMIVTIGGVATRAMTGKAGITRMAGKLIKQDKRKVFPLIHPSFMLRNGVHRLDFGKDSTNRHQIRYRADVQKLKKAINEIKNPEEDIVEEEQGYVPIHCHDHHSILDSAVTTKNLVRTAKRMGFKAIAQTNHATMSGTYRFYKECEEKEIKPIIGCEFYFVDEARRRKKQKAYHIVLLAKNYKGYKNLLKLCTLANVEGYYYRPRIDPTMLSKYSDNLIMTTGCLGSPFSRKDKTTKELVDYFDETFPHSWFIELQVHNHKDQIKLNKKLVDIANVYSKPMVVTNDVHYALKEDALLRDIIWCVRDKKKLTEEVKSDIRTLYLMKETEMREKFQKFHPTVPIDEALENTYKIANMCDVELKRYDNVLPEMDLPKDYESSANYFEYLVKKKFSEKFPDEDKEYLERIKEEMRIIVDKKFYNYFLMVYDVVDHAKKKGIMVGPGRGSVCGSLTAYVLGITRVDPIEHDILFFRFISPERNDYPDIDIDFQDNRRGEVVDYIVKKYGDNCVSKIMTCNVYHNKMAFKDVARCYGIPFTTSNNIASLLSNDKDMDYIFETNEELKKFKDKNPDVVKYASKMVGLIRNKSQHAAGVLVTNKPLDSYIALERVSKGDEFEYVSCYDMRDCEDLGLIKFDILRLSTLTVISQAKEFIKKGWKYNLDIEGINLTDQNVLDTFFEGDTISVFQFDKLNMRRLLRRMSEATQYNKDLKMKFEDIVAANALHRPGPLESGQTESYVLRGKGEEDITYPHPIVKDILEPTKGLIVYQDQLMLICNQLAGLDWPVVNKIRKAVGKSLGYEAIKVFNDQFVEGAMDNGVDKEVAQEIFDGLVKFGKYAFNKAHAIAYSMPAYWCQYLKEYHPVEYYAAVLSYVGSGKEKMIPNYVYDARVKGIAVHGPSINSSSPDYSIVDEEIYCGLSNVKGVGIKAANAIVKKQPYKSFSDFMLKINKRTVNRKIIRSLLEAGAFDELNANTKSIIKNMDYIMKNKHMLMNSTLDGNTFIDNILDEDDVYNESESILNRMTVIPITPSDTVPISLFKKHQHINEDRMTSINNFVEDEKQNRILICGFASQVEKKATFKSMRCMIHDHTGGIGVFMPVNFGNRMADGELIIAKGSSEKDQASIFSNEFITVKEFMRQASGEEEVSPFFEYLTQDPLNDIVVSEESNIGSIKEMLESEKEYFRITAYIGNISPKNSSYGLYYYLQLEDASGSISVTAWPNTVEEYEDVLIPGSIIEIPIRRNRSRYTVDSRRGSDEIRQIDIEENKDRTEKMA